MRYLSTIILTLTAVTGTNAQQTDSIASFTGYKEAVATGDSVTQNTTIKADQPKSIVPIQYSTRPEATTLRYPAVLGKEDFEWTDKIGFIIGLGFNNAIDDIYDIPSIDPTTKFVHLDRLQRYRFNSAFGISYTYGPIVNVRRAVWVPVDEYLVERWTVVRYPRGFTTSVFFAPNLLSNPDNINIAKSTDVGIGVGFRNGPVSYFFTGEFFRLPQPRGYFMAKHQSGNTQHLVDGAPQATLSTTDENIFYTRWYLSFGFKICYTLDVFKQFSNAKNDLLKNHALSGAE